MSRPRSHKALKEAQDRWLGDIEDLHALAHCGELEEHIRTLQNPWDIFLTEREAAHIIISGEQPYVGAQALRLVARHHPKRVNQPSPRPETPLSPNNPEQGWASHLQESLQEDLTQWVSILIRQGSPESLKLPAIKAELGRVFSSGDLGYRIYEQPHILGGVIYGLRGIQEELEDASRETPSSSPGYFTGIAAFFPVLREHRLVRPYLMKPNSSAVAWRHIAPETDREEFAQLVDNILQHGAQATQSSNWPDTLAKILENARPEQLQSLSSKQLRKLCGARSPRLRQAGLRVSRSHDNSSRKLS